MSIFSNMTAGDGGNTPFTEKRWPAVLTSLDINHGVDDDGDCAADWDGVRVWFEARGEQKEILSVKAIWDFRPPLEAYQRLALETCEWNASHLWPRAFVVRGEEDCLVIGDLDIDCETGVTDEFLRQQVRCILATSFELFEHLGKTFPEHTSWRNVTEE